MSRDNLVQRLISFLKKPDALEYDSTPNNSYDDYEPQPVAPEPVEVEVPVTRQAPEMFAGEQKQGFGSRLDALVMRAVEQFKAQSGYVIRCEGEGRMRYCTGRDIQGNFIDHTQVDIDRRALFLALDSGESQLFVHTVEENNNPAAVLCGPLLIGDEVVGVLYLDNPARSRLHRGVFDVFCDQAARMLNDGIA
jgi:hypothetical protein